MGRYPVLGQDPGVLAGGRAAGSLRRDRINRALTVLQRVADYVTLGY